MVGPVQGDLAVTGPEALVDLGVAGEAEGPGAVGAGRDLRGPELHGHIEPAGRGGRARGPDPDPEGADLSAAPQQAGRARGEVDHHLVGHRPDLDLVALDPAAGAVGPPGQQDLQPGVAGGGAPGLVDQERCRAPPGQLLGEHGHDVALAAGPGPDGHVLDGKGDIGRGVAELEHARLRGRTGGGGGRPCRGVERGRRLGRRWPAAAGQRQDHRDQGGDGGERWRADLQL